MDSGGRTDRVNPALTNLRDKQPMRHVMIIILFLAACGGGTGPAGPGQESFAQSQGRVAEMGFTYGAALPQSGVAQYQGRAQLNLPLQGGAQNHEGALALRIAFDGIGDPVTGQISGLRSAAGPVTGQLQISGGAIDRQADTRNDYQFTANIAGNLAQGGQVWQTSAQLAGDFHGSAAQAVSGVIYRGAIRQGGMIDLFDGAFVADARPSGG
jgi:hypothetical protein